MIVNQQKAEEIPPTELTKTSGKIEITDAYEKVEDVEEASESNTNDEQEHVPDF